jgi:hypothetical protein
MQDLHFTAVNASSVTEKKDKSACKSVSHSLYSPWPCAASGA